MFSRFEFVWINQLLFRPVTIFLAVMNLWLVAALIFVYFVFNYYILFGTTLLKTIPLPTEYCVRGNPSVNNFTDAVQVAC